MENRWEISSGVTVIWYNTSASSPNPPALGLGTWVENGIGCNNLLQFNGSGTQSSLPVELISFIGTYEKNQIELTWQTGSEINNEKFEIEESQDGREFQKIGEIKGNGTTVERQAYSFTDKNPSNGISYYRLKQIDFDGQFEYSKMISIISKDDNGNVGAFYPNPSKSGFVNLNYNSQDDEAISISVFNVTGKLVDNQIQQVSNGENNLNFDFSHFNAGIYIVKIGDERNSTRRKLIIER